MSAITMTFAAFMPHMLAVLTFTFNFTLAVTVTVKITAAFPFHAFAELSASIPVTFAAFPSGMFAVLPVLTLLNFRDSGLHGWESRWGFHGVSWHSSQRECRHNKRENQSMLTYSHNDFPPMGFLQQSLGNALRRR